MKQTLIFSMHENSPDSKALAQCAALIRNGGLVAFPTETVYGLGANALDDEACAGIYVAKNRPADKPLLCHLADLAQAEEIAYLTDTAYLLIEKFTPGPLTVIVRKKTSVGRIVSGGQDTVGLRFPANFIARELIRLSGVPIAAPSANLSGFPPPTSGKQTYENLSGRIDAVIDGGETSVGLPSTIVTLCEERPRILRQGTVTAEQLRRYIDL